MTLSGLRPSISPDWVTTGSACHFFIIIVIRHESTAAARWALLLIVSTLFNDAITVAVWTGFHVCLQRPMKSPMIPLHESADNAVTSWVLELEEVSRLQTVIRLCRPLQRTALLARQSCARQFFGNCPIRVDSRFCKAHPYTDKSRLRAGSGKGTAESSARRIGVLASAVKLSGGGDLDDLAEIHHRTPRKKRRRSTDIRFMATAFRGMKLRYGPDQTDPYGRSPPGCRLHRFHFCCRRRRRCDRCRGVGGAQPRRFHPAGMGSEQHGAHRI